MSGHLLVLNGGSSSLKFCLYAQTATGPWATAARGAITGLGRSPRFVAVDASGSALPTPAVGPGTRAAPDALDTLMSWLAGRDGVSGLSGIGHRVVHGGPRPGPALVTPALLAELRELVPLAPLHQPGNLALIDALGKLLPGVPQVACFDTSFHQGHAPVAEVVPLPAAVRDRGVRRYGFHGLSCEYIASVLPQVAPAVADGRVIIAHLGSGASLCALRGARSMDSTFGFTALDGLCMGTRPGSIDPGVVLYLFQGLGLGAREVERMLYEQSGLVGISGTSSDMRDLLGSSEAPARLAVDYFVYRAAREIGALAAVLGGLDALVFTAGIGEHSSEIRARIATACAWLGMELDPAANAAGGPCLTGPGSRVSAWMIPTDEELMIARQASIVLGLAPAGRFPAPGKTT